MRVGGVGAGRHIPRQYGRLLVDAHAAARIVFFFFLRPVKDEIWMLLKEEYEKTTMTEWETRNSNFSQKNILYVAT